MLRRVGLAFRAFWLALFRAEVAERIREALAKRPRAEVVPPAGAEARAEVAEKPRPARREEVPASPPGRSEALTLLATLQRQGRFVDFLMEPLDAYSDAQIGAAVRDIHRDCAKVLQQIFGLKEILAEAEGQTVELPAQYDAARIRLLGERSGAGPIRGRVIHRGWEATRCELPTWTGSPSGAMVIAPAEVQLEGAPVPRLGEGFGPPAPQ